MIGHIGSRKELLSAIEARKSEISNHAGWNDSEEALYLQMLT